MSLSGRLALVTGGGQGLGLEIARGLGRAGADVLLNGRDAERLAEPVRRLRAEGITVTPLAFDITDGTAAASALGSQEPVDILINNVGQRDRRGVLEMETADFAALVQVDLTAAFGLTRLVARRLVASARTGSVINMSSIAGGTLGNADDVAYQAAKAGLEGLTRALAADLGPHRIRVNAVAPGAFSTEVNATDFARAEYRAWIARRSALGRFGRPEEIAGIVVFLAGEGASYLTGQIIAVDGGLSTRY